MQNSHGQWAPWITDSDPPEKPMSPAQLKKLGAGAAKLLGRKPIIRDQDGRPIAETPPADYLQRKAAQQAQE